MYIVCYGPVVHIPPTCVGVCVCVWWQSALINISILVEFNTRTELAIVFYRSEKKTHIYIYDKLVKKKTFISGISQ